MEADGMTSRAFQAFGTILAGCSSATTAARIILVRLLHKTQNTLPTLHMWNVVDDVSLHASGSDRMVSHALGNAGNMLAAGLVDLRLPLAKNKSKFLASSDEVAMQLQAVWKDNDFKRVSTTRNVGGDAGDQKKRRIPIAKNRFTASLKRNFRLRALRRAGGTPFVAQMAGAVKW